MEVVRKVKFCVYFDVRTKRFSDRLDESVRKTEGLK